MNLWCDGTWNTPEDNTNIYKLYLKYGGHYFPGPGTKEYISDRIFGGAFGVGLEGIVDRAYQAYKENYDGHLMICGYSRGAAAARRLAHKIASEGGVVDFLGCYDTVSSLGVPLPFWPFTYSDDLFMSRDVHPRVKKAAHVLALDEERIAFQNTPMNPREGIVERGFPGDHGYAGNSDATLRWMDQQFAQSL